MAVLAPLAIPAAETIWAAMVAAGSALAGGMGIIALSEAIKEKFAEKKTSAVEECSQRQKCGEFRAEILEKYSKLGKELANTILPTMR